VIWKSGVAGGSSKRETLRQNSTLVVTGKTRGTPQGEKLEIERQVRNLE